MELELVAAGARDYRGHVVGTTDKKVNIELVVRSIEDAASPPPFVDVRGGAGARIDPPEVAHPRRETELGQDANDVASGYFRTHLRRRGETLFYPLTVTPSAPDWAFFRRLEFEVRANEKSAPYCCTLIGRHAILLAMSLLLVSGVVFAVRLVPVAMRLAPTNSNLVLALVLQGTPAAVVAGIVFGAFRESLLRLRDGELSVLGMQRPLTMLAVTVLVTGVSVVLPPFCWEIGNATHSTIKANWSSYESVDFPSSSWVSAALTPRPDVAAMSRLFPDYAKRYCGVACPTGRAPLDKDCKISPSEKPCSANREGAWYEVFCRSPVWAYPNLVPTRNTSKDPLGVTLDTDPSTCAPREPAEAEATIEQTRFRLIWNESSPPSEALVRDYVGQAASSGAATKSLPRTRQAMKVRLEAVEPDAKIQVIISATPEDPAVARWLGQTWIEVTPEARDYFVPVSPDTDRITLALRDGNGSGRSNGTLSCSRTAKQSFGVRVLMLSEMHARAYEQTSGGVDSRWHSPDDAPFIAMCYDESAGPPSSANLQISRLTVPPIDGKPGTAALKFPLSKAPTRLTVFIKDAQQGDVSCERSEPTGSTGPAEPWVWFENKHAEKRKLLGSKPGLSSSWTGVDTTKNVPPWFCSSRDGEELKKPADAVSELRIGGRGASCCFSAGHMSLMDCQEPAWTCRPKRFESSLDGWLASKGCEPRAIKECVRAVP